MGLGREEWREKPFTEAVRYMIVRRGTSSHPTNTVYGFGVAGTTENQREPPRVQLVYSGSHDGKNRTPINQIRLQARSIDRFPLESEITTKVLHHKLCS